jgi:hypothetical protein
MTAATINKINAAIAKHGLEVVKGNGYFWFAALSDDVSPYSVGVPSVYSMTLRCMSLEDWIAHVEHHCPVAA